uniref:Uncharacterized protein n=1 Tax=Mucochytrium quahogii TaxID=96639 RepID=A0A7S2RC92_9STRA|mmetsp:Transcript_9002/g.14650  ORF Transcript_9002/g.14650 Transcript_9002/m.14650 type:complete len:103 (+) Transcript_9002:2929-3237(+)
MEFLKLIFVALVATFANVNAECPGNCQVLKTTMGNIQTCINGGTSTTTCACASLVRFKDCTESQTDVCVSEDICSQMTGTMKLICTLTKRVSFKTKYSLQCS